MTPREAAKIIGCDESHVRRMIRGGRLAAVAYQLPGNRVAYDVNKSDALQARKNYLLERRGRPRREN